MAVSAILGEGAGGSQREPYHVVSMHPCYQSLMEVARSTGATVDSWTAKEDDLRCVGPCAHIRACTPMHTPTRANATQRHQQAKRIIPS